MINKLRHTIPASMLAAAMLLGACEQEQDESIKTGGSTRETTHPGIENVFVQAKPAGALSVTEARKKAEAGNDLTVVGRIAGTSQPFAESYASLVLADSALETCDKIPGDTCKTPWDACCVPNQDIKASRLSVQVLGEDGMPVEQSLRGAGGLTELDRVIVTGRVAEGSTEDNLIINATEIYRDEPS